MIRALGATGEAVKASGRDDRIIVVDNTAAHIAESVVGGFAEDTTAKVVYLQSEPGSKSAALNAGIRASDTEWLAFTDDDCLPDRDWLVQARRYIGQTRVNVLSGRLEPGQVDFRLPRWLRDGAEAALPWSPAFARYKPLAESGILGPDARVPFGANFFVRRDVFDRCGNYDEALWKQCGFAALGCEDAEFGIRVRKHGESIGYCAEALVIHPVYPERATLRYYLRHVYHAGIREPVFAEHGRTAPMPYLFKSMCFGAVRSAWQTVWNHPTASVRELMAAVRDAGEIRGRIRMPDE